MIETPEMISQRYQNQSNDDTVGPASTDNNTVTTTENNPTLSPALDVLGYGIDSAAEETSKSLGASKSVTKAVSSSGSVITGITTAFDINATINNNRYTTGQKILKGTIQLTQGALDVGGSTVIAGLAAGGAEFSGGTSIVAGAAGIVILNKGINSGADWLCNKLGL